VSGGLPKQSRDSMERLLRRVGNRSILSRL
jgi:hypothetical protein